MHTPEDHAAQYTEMPFAERHIGPTKSEVSSMLKQLGLTSLDDLVAAVVPSAIRIQARLGLPEATPEPTLLEELRGIAETNEVWRSYIGMGYSGTHTPPVLLRNILENPGFYTQYTPYQAEIAQGRLELLLNFQTMVSDLVGLPLANASLLDEATAAAEAMAMCVTIARGKRRCFFAADNCHPQTLAVLKTRANASGIELQIGDVGTLDDDLERYCGVLVQYPDTNGQLRSPAELAAKLHAAGTRLVVATDLLALTLVAPPGQLGADIVVGSTQRFGVPMGYGGPHAAFLATTNEYKRQIPGRIVGVSRDTTGKLAYRLAIQTREQHIRRDRATSNICTAQVLLAILATLYASHHGPGGLSAIARRIHRLTVTLKRRLEALGQSLSTGPFFDTIRVHCSAEMQTTILERAKAKRINLRRFPNGDLGISLDETVRLGELQALLSLFGDSLDSGALDSLFAQAQPEIPASLVRQTPFLEHPAFNSYHTEHEMLRYLVRLQSRDLSLTTSMIPLGSCTMKLNATASMLPITWPAFGAIHPFAPAEQTLGYQRIMSDLKSWIARITGFDEVSLQPNSGAQGEYAGLLAIRGFHQSRGQAHRRVCLIPNSAHGTNPASAVMAGFEVVAVSCDEKGNIDVDDLAVKADAHSERLGALMLTYPSTHGVFETEVGKICQVIHARGGQVYLDGANMNAQVGLCRPADYGADVCHLNLHKTFSIPHGGGGPGVGPIAVAGHLAPFLPSTSHDPDSTDPIGPVAAAPHGSAGVLPIPWMYIRQMGENGLTEASSIAILNANYMASRLAEHFPVLYSGELGFCAHEFIIDARPFKKSAGVEVDDIAKRLMDYGFHAPTMSFPVPGTLMIEPTESEGKAELDRFCDAMIGIREEIRQIETGAMPLDESPLRLAPHTAEAATASEWRRPYSRQIGAFPAPWTRSHKYWPPVGRIDNAAGDRQLICTCPSVESYSPFSKN